MPYHRWDPSVPALGPFRTRAAPEPPFRPKDRGGPGVGLDWIPRDHYHGPVKMAKRNPSKVHVPVQLELPRHAGWGGRRVGAGRKRAAGVRPSVPHRRRPPHAPAHPLHLTLRVVSSVPSLRGLDVFPAVHAALSRAQREGFRITTFSVQDDHLHLIVEASDRAVLVSGARGLQVRLARTINRMTGHRGRVMGDRYHIHVLRTPREVRFALVYVLHNFRKHQPGASTVVDPCSSAGSFDGYDCATYAEPNDATKPPRTWLLRVGWRRHGLLRPTERPATAHARGTPATR